MRSTTDSDGIGPESGNVPSVFHMSTVMRLQAPSSMQLPGYGSDAKSTRNSDCRMNPRQSSVL